MADFDPRQLDLLEDALEGLEDIDDLESLELSPALTERLAEYQDVLALCRDAFPVEEPPDDLLADVLLEAHAVSRRPKLREASGGRWRRFWERWRGTLVPSLALAGTAAAVLLLLEPGHEPERDELLSQTQRAEEDPKPSDDRDTTPSEPASEPRADNDDHKSDPEPEDADNQTAPTPALEKPTSKSATPSKKLPRPSTEPKSKPEPAPEPAPEPLSKDETWKTLDRANADRRRGDCDHARARYEQVIAASSDTLAVARAKAGIGLCLEQDRRTAEADKWFSQARSANAGIDAWIVEQREEQPLPGETKKKHRIKKAMPAETDAL